MTPMCIQNESPRTITLNGLKQAIVKQLQCEPGQSAKELAHVTGRDITTVKSAVKSLQNCGYLYRACSKLYVESWKPSLPLVDEWA